MNSLKLTTGRIFGKGDIKRSRQSYVILVVALVIVLSIAGTATFTTNEREKTIERNEISEYNLRSLR